MPPELWLPQGGVSRKQKELYLPYAGANRKQKELWLPSGGVNRKVFSAAVNYTSAVTVVSNNTYITGYFEVPSGKISIEQMDSTNESQYYKASVTRKFVFDSPIVIPPNGEVVKLYAYSVGSHYTWSRTFSCPEANSSLEANTTTNSYSLTNKTGVSKAFNAISITLNVPQISPDNGDYAGFIMNYTSGQLKIAGASIWGESGQLDIQT